MNYVRSIGESNSRPGVICFSLQEHEGRRIARGRCSQAGSRQFVLAGVQRSRKGEVEAFL